MVHKSRATLCHSPLFAWKRTLGAGVVATKASPTPTPVVVCCTGNPVMVLVVVFFFFLFFVSLVGLISTPGRQGFCLIGERRKACRPWTIHGHQWSVEHPLWCCRPQRCGGRRGHLPLGGGALWAPRSVRGPTPRRVCCCGSLCFSRNIRWWVYLKHAGWLKEGKVMGGSGRPAGGLCLLAHGGGSVLCYRLPEGDP